MTSKFITILLLLRFAYGFKYPTFEVTSRKQFAVKISNKFYNENFQRLDNVISASSTSSREVLLYLPGIDGIGTYSLDSLRNMSENFDVWRMVVDPKDRSSFVALANSVIAFISTFDDSIVLMGESLGGVIALYISIYSPSSVSKLILINPATSFIGSRWADIDSLIPYIRPAFPPIFLLTLMKTVVSPKLSFDVTRSVISRIKTDEDRIRETKTLLSYAQFMTDSDVLQWRLSKWLKVGNEIISQQIKNVQTPTLVLVGNNDGLLPSQQEGRRLERLLPIVEVKYFSQGSHALLADIKDLIKVIKTSTIFKPPRVMKPVDFPYPTIEEIRSADKNLTFLRQSLSPIFLSRQDDGRLSRGIRDLPVGSQGRPVLLVGNHQLFGVDLPLLGREFLLERQELIRGLAHPIVFANDDTSDANSPFGPSLFKRFGAVEVSPSSIFELMKGNATILLYPGGAREALHGKNEKFTLFWPERVDFVRMAALFDAIIVPFAGIGIADSVNILLDGEEVASLPIIGESVRRQSRKMPTARAVGNESFLTPIAIPQLPSRLYFLFQKPVDTRELNVYDKKACKTAYKQVREEVVSALEILQKFRAADPYRDFLPRAVYELAAGSQAPTAPLNGNYYASNDS